MKLSEEQLNRFTEIFEIKARSVILIEKQDMVTIIINSVIIFNVKKELVKEFFLCWEVIFMSDKKYKIIVKDFLDKQHLHNPADAETIVNDILENNKENKNVEIDFRGVKTANSAFCNIIYEGLKGKYNIVLNNCNRLIIETFKRVVG